METNANIWGQCHPKVKAETSVLLVQTGELQRCPANRRTLRRLGQREPTVPTPGSQAFLRDRETGAFCCSSRPSLQDLVMAARAN